MSPTHHDFVVADPESVETSYVGVVVDITHGADGAPVEYDIQLWDSSGPRTVVLSFPADVVSLHGEGRECVMDNSSNPRFNHR